MTDPSRSLRAVAIALLLADLAIGLFYAWEMSDYTAILAFVAVAFAGVLTVVVWGKNWRTTSSGLIAASLAAGLLSYAATGAEWFYLWQGLALLGLVALAVVGVDPSRFRSWPR